MLFPYGPLLAALRGWNLEIKYGTPAYWAGLGLLALVLLFVLLKGYREWQEIHDVDEPDSPEDLLRSFREAHAQGELDDDEFRRVERRLSSSSTSSGPSAELGGRVQSGGPVQPSRLEAGGLGPTAVSHEDGPERAPAEPDRPAGRDRA